jgi:hypothetical protein
VNGERNIEERINLVLTEKGPAASRGKSSVIPDIGICQFSNQVGSNLHLQESTDFLAILDFERNLLFAG